jgi:dTDP-4-amino-4,6-dideoxygalactose transaminase
MRDTHRAEKILKCVVHPDYFDVYHIFNVRHPKRDELRQHLLDNNIKTEIHYPVAPVDQEAMKGILDGQETPIAQLIHATTLSLPISFYHTEADVIRVVEAMNNF